MATMNMKNRQGTGRLSAQDVMPAFVMVPILAWSIQAGFGAAVRKAFRIIYTALYGVIEANLVYQARNRINGREDPDSGGVQLFLTPGIQYVTRRWILEGAVQMPVIQDLNGTALENDYIIRTGVRFNF